MSKIHSDQWVLYLLRGIFAFIFGLMALILPPESFTSLVIFLGAFMIADGVLSILFSTGTGSRTWQKVILLGITIAVVGVLAFISPFMAIIALLTLFAIWSFFSGLNEMLEVLSSRGRRGEGWYSITILLCVLIGMLVLVNPSAESLTLSMAFGLYALLTGTLLVYLSFRLKTRLRHRAKREYHKKLSHY
jgi:uncharacterized membrane protein HdeD (DUF308 family)